MADFGDVWGAAGEGAQVEQQMFNNYLYNKAQGALEAQYGPMAGNPQGALQMQQYNYLSGLDPTLIQAQQLQNQGQSTTNQLKSNLLPYQTSAAQSEAAQAANQTQVSTALVPSAIQAGVAGNTQAAATGSAVTDQIQLQQRMGRLAGITTAVKANINQGMDPAKAFDSALPSIQALTGKQIPPEELQAWRAHVIQGGPAALDEVSNIAKQIQMGQLDPSALLKYGEGVLNMQKTAAETSNTQQTATNAAFKQFTDAQGQESDAVNTKNGMPVIASRANSALTGIQNARALINGMDENGFAKAIQGYVPGSSINQLHSYLTQVGASMSLADLRANREQGNNLGRVTQQEFMKAGEAMAAIDPKNMTRAQMLEQLGNAENVAKLTKEDAVEQGRIAEGRLPAATAARIAAQQRYNYLQGNLSGVGSQPPATGANPPTPAVGAAPAGGGAVPSPAGPDTPATRALKTSGVDLPALEQQNGLPRGYLGAMASIEDPTGNRFAANPSGAKGPAQFVPATAKQYGVTDPTDPQQSMSGAAQLGRDNMKVLSRAGQPVDVGHVYLAHQQGAAGALDILQHPDEPAEGARFTQNTPKGMQFGTKGDFADYWIGRANRLAGSSEQMPPAQQGANLAQRAAGAIQAAARQTPAAPAQQPRVAAAAPASSAASPAAPALPMLTANLGASAANNGVLGNVLASSQGQAPAPVTRPAPIAAAPAPLGIHYGSQVPSTTLPGSPMTFASHESGAAEHFAAAGRSPTLTGRALLAKYLGQVGPKSAAG